MAPTAHPSSRKEARAVEQLLQHHHVLRGTSYTRAGFMLSMSPIGCGGRQANIVNTIFPGVTSMMEKPFFSVGFSASSIPSSCDGLDSTARKDEGNGMSPVPSIPASTTWTWFSNDSSPDLRMEPAAEA